MVPVTQKPAPPSRSTRAVDFAGILLMAVLIALLYVLALRAVPPGSDREGDATVRLVGGALAFGFIDGLALALVGTVGSRAPYCPRRALRGMVAAALGTCVAATLIAAVGGDRWMASGLAGTLFSALLTVSMARGRSRFACSR